MLPVLYPVTVGTMTPTQKLSAYLQGFHDYTQLEWYKKVVKSCLTRLEGVNKELHSFSTDHNYNNNNVSI